METFILAIVILITVLATLGYFFITIIALFDDVCLFLFDRPRIIHFYVKKEKISPLEEFILLQKFPFYRRLSDKHKKYFNHRLAKFNLKYKFIPRQNIHISKEMETMIGATFVMLTYGMRHFLIDTFDKIIIYPDEYFSTNSNQYFKGEFNPKLSKIVFSWKHFVEGYEVKNDNLNLGIHEFAHAIHFHCLNNSDASSLCFKKHYSQILKEINRPVNKQKLINSDYFRIYAYTNQFEFVSVILEHYFETPNEFKAEFSELYSHVELLLNHKH